MHIGNKFSHSSFQFGNGHDNGRHNGIGHGGAQQARQFPQFPQLQQGQRPDGQQGQQGEQGNSGNRYTVQQGDSLWQLSDRMRAAGDGRNNWDIIGEIARDNGIKNPDMIFPGHTLNLRGPMSPDSFVPTQNPNSPLQPTTSQIPTPDGQLPGARNDGIKWIGQMDPTGEDKNYKNAEQNCGPAVMAMLARKLGKGGNLDDADLITELGKIGKTDGNGTTGNGLIAMADQMGVKSQATPGTDAAFVMSQLQQGKTVVANGDYYALPQHADATKDSPHYILLTGIDEMGNIKVEDPMDGNVRAITIDQLKQFNAGQPEGGFNIAFG